MNIFSLCFSFPLEGYDLLQAIVAGAEQEDWLIVRKTTPLLKTDGRVLTYCPVKISWDRWYNLILFFLFPPLTEQQEYNELEIQALLAPELTIWGERREKLCMVIFYCGLFLVFTPFIGFLVSALFMRAWLIAACWLVAMVIGAIMVYISIPLTPEVPTVTVPMSEQGQSLAEALLQAISNSARSAKAT